MQNLPGSQLHFLMLYYSGARGYSPVSFEYKMASWRYLVGEIKTKNLYWVVIGRFVYRIPKRTLFFIKSFIQDSQWHAIGRELYYLILLAYFILEQ